VEVLKINLGVIGVVKELVYSSKPIRKYILIALAIYSSFIERLEDKGKLFKKELVVRSKTIGFNTFALFRYMGVIELYNLLPIINSLYNRAKI
jgi:hypothetical protein